MTAIPHPLWTPPRRPLWTPPRPRLRVPSLTELFAGGIQRNPATGGAKRHATHGGGLRSNADGSCCCPLWHQAKRCRTNESVDLWVPDSVARPNFFTITTGSTVIFYFVDDTCNTSATPGTIATSVTGYASTIGCPCGCNPGPNPQSWTITATGVSTCSSYGFSGDPNGTWCVARNGSESSCSSVTLTLPSRFSYVDPFFGDTHYVDAYINVDYNVGSDGYFLRGSMITNYGSGGGGGSGALMWSTTVTLGGSNCMASVSGSNAVICSDGSDGDVGTPGAGHHGTISITPNFGLC